MTIEQSRESQSSITIQENDPKNIALTTQKQKKNQQKIQALMLAHFYVTLRRNIAAKNYEELAELSLDTFLR